MPRFADERKKSGVGLIKHLSTMANQPTPALGQPKKGSLQANGFRLCPNKGHVSR
jgi:hypothetical protein